MHFSYELDFVVEKSLRTANLLIHDHSWFPYTLSTPRPLIPGPDSQVSHWNSHQHSSRYLDTHSACSYAITTLDNFQNPRAQILSKHRLTPMKFCSQLRVLWPYSYAIKQNTIPITTNYETIYHKNPTNSNTNTISSLLTCLHHAAYRQSCGHESE